MYLKAAERNSTELEDVLIPWEKARFQDTTGHSDFGIDEHKIPHNRLDAFRAAKKQQLVLFHNANEAVMKVVQEGNNRPTCRFEFDLHSIGIRPNDPNGRDDLWRACPLYARLNVLLDNFVYYPFAKNNQLERLLLGLRMSARLRRPAFGNIRPSTQAGAKDSRLDRRVGNGKTTYEG